MTSTNRRHRGFSLLEVMVAFAIAALALTMLYQVMGNNARQAGGLGQHERAMMLAESLLASCASVPPQGIDEGDQSAGYQWRLRSQPFPTPADDMPQAPHLHEVQASVQWLDGNATRSFDLTTLRPEMRPRPGATP
jgi:general secretion pathway protein I